MSGIEMQRVARSEDMDLLLRRSLQTLPGDQHGHPRRIPREVQPASSLRVSVTADEIVAATKAKAGGHAQAGERPHGPRPTNLHSIRRNPAPIVVRSARPSPSARPTCVICQQPCTILASGTAAVPVPGGLEYRVNSPLRFRPHSPADDPQPQSSRHRTAPSDGLTHRGMDVAARMNPGRSSAVRDRRAVNSPPAWVPPAGSRLTMPSGYRANHQDSNEGRDGAILSVDEILRAIDREPDQQYADPPRPVDREVPLPGPATSDAVHSGRDRTRSIAAVARSIDNASRRASANNETPSGPVAQRVDGPERVTLTEAMRLVRERRAEHDTQTRSHMETVNGYRREAHELSDWAVPPYPRYRITDIPARAWTQPRTSLRPRHVRGIDQFPETDGPQPSGLGGTFRARSPTDNAPNTPRPEIGTRDPATMERLARAIAESSGLASQEYPDPDLEWPFSPRAALPYEASDGEDDEPAEDSGPEAVDSDEAEESDEDEDSDEEDEDSDEEDEDSDQEAAYNREETAQQSYERQMRMAAYYRAAARARGLIETPEGGLRRIPVVGVPAAPGVPDLLESRVATASGSRTPVTVNDAASNIPGSVSESEDALTPVMTPAAPPVRVKRERVYISLLDL